jgi:hypothetical protein
MSEKKLMVAKCKCSTTCKFIITKKEKLEEIQDDEKSSLNLLSLAEKSIHCHVCRKKIKSPLNDDDDNNNILENDGDYFLCISCQRESPTCEFCLEKVVEPDDEGNWQTKCISCK